MSRVSSRSSDVLERRPGRSLSAAMVFLIAVLSSLAPAIAANAATVVERYRFHGTVVSGSSYDYDWCSEWGSNFTADQDTVVYSSFFRNTCPGEEVSSFISGEAVPTTFTVDRNTVHIVATIPMTNVETGESAGEILVDETFTATSRWLRYSSTNRTQLPGEYHRLERSMGTQATAAESGSLYFDFASINKSKSFSVGIYHS